MNEKKRSSPSSVSSTRQGYCRVHPFSRIVLSRSLTEEGRRRRSELAARAAYFLKASLTFSPACFKFPETSSTVPSASSDRSLVAFPTPLFIFPLALCNLFLILSSAPMVSLLSLAMQVYTQDGAAPTGRVLKVQGGGARGIGALADAMPAEYHPMVYLGAVLGLRWAEVAGLEVRSLDLDRSSLTVAPEPLRLQPGCNRTCRHRPRTARQAVQLRAPGRPRLPDREVRPRPELPLRLHHAAYRGTVTA